MTLGWCWAVKTPGPVGRAALSQATTRWRRQTARPPRSGSAGGLSAAGRLAALPPPGASETGGLREWVSLVVAPGEGTPQTSGLTTVPAEEAPWTSPPPHPADTQGRSASDLCPWGGGWGSREGRLRTPVLLSLPWLPLVLQITCPAKLRSVPCYYHLGPSHLTLSVLSLGPGCFLP